jgi:hypothetical protein
MIRTALALPIDFSPRPRCNSNVHGSSPRRAGEPVKRARSLSGAREPHTTMRSTGKGSPAVTLGGQWLGCMEATRTMHHYYGLSRHRPTSPRTPARSSIASLPSNKVAQLCLAPSSSRGASPDITIQDAKEGTKGNKKRCKHHHQETATTTNDDGGTDKQAGDSSVVHAVMATSSGKRQPRPPTYHFKQLLEETCPNHTYPIKHKLRDCDMMKSFMTSGSLP